MSYTNRFVQEDALSEAFYFEICLHCDKIQCIGATLINPPEITCPCGLDHTDPRCAHNDKWVDLLFDLEDAFIKAFGKW